MKTFSNIGSLLRQPGFVFRSLKYRNYRYYFLGQLISLPGNWIQNIALSWLVYRLTGSAFMLGIVGFTSQIPALVLTPVAGVYADRLNRRKVLILTQSISAGIALVMAGITLSGAIRIWHILAAALINGITVAFDTPFRHAFVVEMVTEKQDLPNAIALNSTLFNTARFIGPPVGGMLIAIAGEGICFLINGLSYLAVIGTLAAMKVHTSAFVHKGKSVLSDLASGIRYSWQTLPIRYLLLMVITTSLLGLPYQVFMPVYASDILGGGAQTLGFLNGAIGAGALGGAFFLASRRELRNFPRMVFLFALISSLGLMAFSHSGYLALSLMLLVVTGFGMIAEFNASNTLLQTVVDDGMRGRVVAFYSMSFMGIQPLGSLALGSLAEWAGIQPVLLVSGTLCLLASLVFSRKTNIIGESLKRTGA